MAKIFLDTNVFIDLVEEREQITLPDFLGNELFISPLSIHILTYIYKYNIPNDTLSEIQNYFNFVPFDEIVTKNALVGPTQDFEDNVQLHSAAEAECNVFLTNDQQLQDLKFFGKTRIINKL